MLDAAIGTVGDRVVAVTGGGDGTVRFWDLRTRTEFAASRAPGSGDVNAVALGEMVGEVAAITGTQDGSTHVWLLLDTVRPALVGGCRLGDVPVVLVRSEPGALSIADVRSGSVMRAVAVGRRGTAVGVRTAIVAGQALPLLSFADGAVSYTSPGSPEPHLVGHHGDRVTALTASRLPNRTVLYTAAGRTVRVWDVETLRVLDTIEVPGEIRALAADPGGYLLVDTGTELICFVRSSEAAGEG